MLTPRFDAFGFSNSPFQARADSKFVFAIHNVYYALESTPIKMSIQNARIFFLITLGFLFTSAFSFPVTGTEVSVDLYTQYSPPFGGQGSHMSSDSFPPNGVVELRTNVTFHGDGVSGKPVLYIVKSPNGKTCFATVFTQTDGIALFEYPIPDSEDYFGEWIVRASVDFDKTTVCDTLHFLVGWLVEVVDIDPPKIACKGETITLNVTLARISMQDPRDIMNMLVKDSSGNLITDNKLLLFITILDELSQPVATSKSEVPTITESGFDINGFVTTVGENWIDHVNVILTLYSALCERVMSSVSIPFSSFSGKAVLSVGLFTDLPGMAYCPESLGDFLVTFQYDLDKNGGVDIADVAKVAKAFGTEWVEMDGLYWHDPSCKCCPHDPTLDLNKDSSVDVFEVVLLAQNFGKTV